MITQANSSPDLATLDPGGVFDRFVTEKHAPEDLRQDLGQLNADAQQMLAELIDRLQPSANMLRDFVTLIREITLRDGLSTAFQVQNPTLRAILDRETASRKEKLQFFRRFLERLRYPEMTRIENQLESMARQIVKTHGVKIEWPQDLEGGRFHVELDFQNPDELLALTQRLKRVAESLELRQMFALLLGREGY